MKRITLLLTLALVVPSVAEAREGGFPNAAAASGVYADALFRSAAADADEWWVSATGYRPPPMRLFVYDKDDDGAAYADSSGHVFLARQYRNEVWVFVNNRDIDSDSRLTALVNLWAVAAHERGHNLGLAHQTEGCPSNIMCADSGSERPWAAIAWARRTLRALRNRRQTA